MKILFIIVTGLAFCNPLYAAKSVRIHFSGNDGCPQHTTFIVNGQDRRCTQNNIEQADLACIAPGDTLEWTSNRPFRLVGIPAGLSVAYSTNFRRAEMTTQAGANHAFKYTIVDAANTCALDPRIIINPGFSLSAFVP